VADRRAAGSLPGVMVLAVPARRRAAVRPWRRRRWPSWSASIAGMGRAVADLEATPPLCQTRCSLNGRGVSGRGVGQACAARHSRHRLAPSQSGWLPPGAGVVPVRRAHF